MVQGERQEEVEHERVVGWDSAAMTEKDVEAAEKLWTELARERAHLDAECTEDEVEQEAEWCQEAMRIILDATAKKIRICAKSMRWWNADIKQRRKAVGREKTKWNSDEAASMKAELQRSIRRSNSGMWSDSIQNLRGAEVWRAAQYANPGAGATVEALTEREGWQANSILEREEMQRRECFRPKHIRKKHFRLGGMAPSECKCSVTAIRDTPVTDYPAPRANRTRHVAYYPLIAVSSFRIALSVS